MKIKKRICITALFALLFSFTACDESGPYVKVGGKTYTESNLKEEMPDRYKNIRENYESQLKRTLKALGEKKLYEAVAKDKGLKDANAYRRTLESKVKAVSEEEIKAKYDFFQKEGQLAGKTLEEVRNQIVSYLRSEKRRDVIQADQIKLKIEYGYEEGPIVRRKVDLVGEPTRAGKGEITIVEFSGYECNYCKKVQVTARKLRKKYGNKITWVMKDYPLRLSSIHAHISAACVFKQDQGKYWVYFDKLFAEDREPDFLTKEKLDAHVATLGINIGKYNQCTADPAIAKEIKADHQEGVSLGVRGTIPYFFINGRPFSGTQSIYAFEELIEDELTR